MQDGSSMRGPCCRWPLELQQGERQEMRQHRARGVVAPLWPSAAGTDAASPPANCKPDRRSPSLT